MHFRSNRELSAYTNQNDKANDLTVNPDDAQAETVLHRKKTTHRIAALAMGLVVIMTGVTSDKPEPNYLNDSSPTMPGLAEPGKKLVKDFEAAGGDNCIPEQSYNSAKMMGVFTENIPADSKSVIKNAKQVLAQYDLAKKAAEFIELPDNFQALLDDAETDNPTIDISIIEQALKDYLSEFNISVIYDWRTPTSDVDAANNGLPTVDIGWPLSDDERTKKEYRLVILGTMEAFSETPKAIANYASIEILYVGHNYMSAATTRSYDASKAPKIMLMGSNITGKDISSDELITYAKNTIIHELWGHGVGFRSPGEPGRYIAECLNQTIFALIPNKIDFKALKKQGFDRYGNLTLQAASSNNKKASTIALPSNYAAKNQSERLAEDATLVSGSTTLLQELFTYEHGDPTPVQKQVAAYIEAVHEIDPAASDYIIALVRLTRYLHEVNKAYYGSNTIKESKALYELLKEIPAALPAASSTYTLYPPTPKSP